MRPAEVYNLRRQNVSIKKGFVQVEDGKTKSSNRKVYLSDKASKVLQFRLEKFKSDHLFPKGEKDCELPTYQLNEQHRETIGKTGLKFRLYDCRHTFATRVLHTGIDLLTLASMLGHSSLDEVMRYAHPSETRKNDAIRQMQKEKAKAV
jgi:integrase